jgi:hypothetical protein
MPTGSYGSVAALGDRQKSAMSCRWSKAEIGQKQPLTAIET